MNDTERWLERYRAHRENLASPWAYWLAVPLVVLGTVCLLWSLPVPAAFVEISPLLNWGSAFLMAAAVYYFILSLPLAIGLLPVLTALAVAAMALAASPLPMRPLALALLVAGTVGLWLGHRHKSPAKAVFEDLQTIMIGPVWLLSVIYRRLGIPY